MINELIDSKHIGFCIYPYVLPGTCKISPGRFDLSRSESSSYLSYKVSWATHVPFLFFFFLVFLPLRSLESSSPTLFGKDVVFRSRPVLYDLLRNSACRLYVVAIWVVLNKNRMSKSIVVYERERGWWNSKNWWTSQIPCESKCLHEFGFKIQHCETSKKIFLLSIIGTYAKCLFLILWNVPSIFKGLSRHEEY